MKKLLCKIPRYEIKLSFPIVVLLVLLAGFLVIITRRAWLNDDAYITFRTVDNLVNGYRLTWNTTERVQSYTHPLWMFLLSIPYFITREIFYTAMALSIMVSFTAVVLFAFTTARSVMGALAGIMILGLSNAFIDYSTSGLENPLTHLLMVIFFLVYFRFHPSIKLLFWASLVASLAALNRQDVILIYLPVLVFLFFTIKGNLWKKILMLALGQIPLILWELFSVLYYGFPFPNTYYAKLHTGVPAFDLVRQGLNYFVNSIKWDPLTLITICASLIGLVVFRKKKLLPVALGILLYLAYIVKIGGDFMAGRFFAAPLLVAVIIISQFDFDQVKAWQKYGSLAAILGIGLLAPLPTFQLGDSSVNNLVDANLIVDERVWYFWDSSFVGRRRGLDMPNVPGRGGGIAVRNEAGDDMLYIPQYNIGVYGYYAGPHVHIVDSLGLADPLMARMPAFYDVEWRIGHYERVIPDGYVYSFYLEDNVIADKDLALYYDKLSLIVKGDLFDPQRLIEIWRMNTGKYDHLIDFNRYRYPELIDLSLDEISGETTSGSYEISDVHKMWDVGLDISTESVSYASALELSLESDDDYRIDLYLGDKKVDTITIKAANVPDGLAVYNEPLSRRAQKNGFDRLHIYPTAGDKHYILGHLKLIK